MLSKEKSKQLLDTSDMVCYEAQVKIRSDYLIKWKNVECYHLDCGPYLRSTPDPAQTLRKPSQVKSSENGHRVRVALGIEKLVLRLRHAFPENVILPEEEAKFEASARSHWASQHWQSAPLCVVRLVNSQQLCVVVTLIRNFFIKIAGTDGMVGDSRNVFAVLVATPITRAHRALKPAFGST